MANPLRIKRPCRCGSGLFDRELEDAAGIFCAYVCDVCEERVRKRYRPSIFEPGTPYASTGNEHDIDIDH